MRTWTKYNKYNEIEPATLNDFEYSESYQLNLKLIHYEEIVALVSCFTAYVYVVTIVVVVVGPMCIDCDSKTCNEHLSFHFHNQNNLFDKTIQKRFS